MNEVKNTKTLIEKKIREATKEIDWNCLDNFSANKISSDINVSRSVVSQYLNEFNNLGIMVKVNSRPVLFMDKKTLVKNQDYLNNVYDTIEELQEAIKRANSRSTAFTQLIGYNGSLNSIVQNCKSAITYPNAGLPILLLGPTGAGKSLIAQTMYQYGEEKGIFNEKSRFITVNCSEYANNPEFFLTNLFGCKKGAYTGADKDREGLVSLADGGMLFLDEVHCLSSECQEKLFLFMDKGIYHMVGDNDKWYEAKEHLVFATTEDPRTALLKTLFRRIPIVTHIPALSARPKQEKKELLIYLLEKEEMAIKTEIEITNRLYQIMVEYDFLENVGQMVNCIKACIGNAYVDINHVKDGVISLDIANMPDYMIEESTKLGYLTQYQDAKFLKLSELKAEQKKELILYSFNDDLINIWDEYGEDRSFDTLYTYCRHRFLRYLDSICFQDVQQVSIKELLYHNVIETICTKISKKYNIVFSNVEIINLSKLINDYVVNVSSCEVLLRNNVKKINCFIQKFKSNDTVSVDIAQEFISSIQVMLNMEFNQLALLDAIISLKNLSSKMKERGTNCIILSHGYSTASSLAAAANHMVDDSIFDSIDMPMDVNVSTIAKKLSEYIDLQKNLKDLIILVDMGSLEDIYTRIQIKDNINIVIFNNVTIKLALDIGGMVKQNFSVQKIKEEIDGRDYAHKSLMLENRRKEKVILSVCSTGIAMAERISNLLEISFPRKSDVKVMAYSYKSMCDQEKSNELLNRYHVQFIVGTMNPNVKGCTYISIEEMIERQNIEKIRNIMGDIFTPQELDLFAENIIKNFSLQNLLDYLTILNPEKIVNYVETIIDYMQKALDLKLSGNIKVGLYLHISCLIERLIMDKYITNYEDIDVFVEKNAGFIQIVKEAFSALEKHYCVEIPVSEIAYIYDYIYRYPSVEERVLSVEESLFDD